MAPIKGCFDGLHEPGCGSGPAAADREAEHRLKMEALRQREVKQLFKLIFDRN